MNSNKYDYYSLPLTTLFVQNIGIFFSRSVYLDLNYICFSSMWENCVLPVRRLTCASIIGPAAENKVKCPGVPRSLCTSCIRTTARSVVSDSMSVESNIINFLSINLASITHLSWSCPRVQKQTSLFLGISPRSSRTYHTPLTCRPTALGDRVQNNRPPLDVCIHTKHYWYDGREGGEVLKPTKSPGVKHIS